MTWNRSDSVNATTLPHANHTAAQNTHTRSKLMDKSRRTRCGPHRCDRNITLHVTVIAHCERFLSSGVVAPLTHFL